jgi:hypothetical protein
MDGDCSEFSSRGCLDQTRLFLGASACEHAAMGMSTMTIANDQVDWEQASLTRTDQNDAEDK